MTGNKDSKLADQAVRAAMVENQQDLLRFLTRRLGDAEDAADVLHDFYVKVLSRIGDLRETEKLRPWMRRVLETTLIDHYRTRGKGRMSETDYQHLELLHPTDRGEDDLDMIICLCLYKLLPTLKLEYATLLWRADLLCESRETIAIALGLTEMNLRVRLHRARQALKRRLEETCRSCPVHGYLDCGCDYGMRLREGVEATQTEL